MKGFDFKGKITFEWYSLLKDVILNLWLLILAAIIGFVSVYVLEVSVYKPVYTSSATLMVQVKTGTYQAYTNLSASSEMATIFSEVFVQPSMKEKAAEHLEKNKVQGRLEASVLTNTNIITLSVTADDPETAYQELRAILTVYPQISDSIFSNAVLDVVSAPEVPKAPSNSSANKYEKLIMSGIVFAVLGAVVLLSLTRDTVKDEKSFNKKIGATHIVTILRERKYRSFGDLLKKKKSKQLVTDAFSSFSFSESYQKIAAKLEHLKRSNGDRIFLITSVAANEGKTTVSVNTAITLANRGKKVALLDMDLMKPSVKKYLEMEHSEGPDLAEVLCGEAEVSQYSLQMYKSGVMRVGLNKGKHRNFSDWINMPYVKRNLDELTKDFDFVIIDSMPISASADLAALANLADKSILVIKADYAQTGEINDAVLMLSENEKFAGCILNDAHVEFSLFGQFGMDENSYTGRHYSAYTKYAGNYTKRQNRQDGGFDK